MCVERRYGGEVGVWVLSHNWDEVSDGDSGGSVLDSWINAASMKPMMRVKRRMEEMAMVVMWCFWVNFWGRD